MSDSSQRKPLLNLAAMKDLSEAKRQILDAAHGRVPEPLLLATALAAVRLSRREAALADVLSERVVELVRESLKAIAQQKWKPDTALMLHKRRGEP